MSKQRYLCLYGSLGLKISLGLKAHTHAAWEELLQGQENSPARQIYALEILPLLPLNALPAWTL